MDEKRIDGERMNFSVQARDDRYPIAVYLNDENEPAFTLYFNPADPFVMEYANNLSNIDAPEANGDTGEFLSFTAKLEKNLDAIFGGGTARLICRYDGADHTLLSAILEKVKEGYADFNERAKAAQEAHKRDARVAAKDEAAAFLRNGK